MEITPAPHRPPSTPWGRMLALVVLLAPVSVLVLLPTGLGLQRYVMAGDSMDAGHADSIPRGALLLERPVPVGDLRVDDVVTFSPPAGGPAGEDRVTHRIVGIDAGGIRTQGDAEPARDPWVLQPEGETLPRVVLVVPWVGYGYLALRETSTWLAIGGVAVLAALLVAAEAARRRSPADGAGEPPVPVPAAASPAHGRRRGGDEK